MTLIDLVVSALLLGVGATGLRLIHRRPPPVRKDVPDYERIFELEVEDELWRRAERTRGTGQDPRMLHLELDALWRHAQTDDSPEVRQRIRQLTADYRQALADEQGGKDTQ